jgi:hypothetical protein
MLKIQGSAAPPRSAIAKTRGHIHMRHALPSSLRLQDDDDPDELDDEDLEDDELDDEDDESDDGGDGEGGWQV